jgi:preprotein translocase SecE subunit
VTSVRRSSTTAKRGSSRFRFIGDTIAELKKVTWLTRREVAYLTGLVLIVAITLGAVLSGIDWGFSGIVNKLLLGG